MTPLRSLARAARRAMAAAVATACLGAPVAVRALEPVTVVGDLAQPWGLAFLPSFERDGRMLVTEKGGRLRIVDTGGRKGPPIEGLPPVDARGQGGLLDVALHPRFEQDGWVYWSYSEPGMGGVNGTAVARAKLSTEGLTGRLQNVQVVFRQVPKVASSAHFGSRLVFGRDGRLFVTLGDRFSRREEAQSLDTHLGKIVRIEADGRVPDDNPFVRRAGAKPEIWSYGHRNAQGAALHPQTGELWMNEHGPQGGDEVNIALPGRNYGWPVITYGKEYGTGATIGEGTARADVEPPLTFWVPSIAPSGMAFLTSDRYPGWKGSAFVGALSGSMLVRLELDGRKVVGEERLLKDWGKRIRAVRQGPDGWLYLLTDSDDGKIARLMP